MLTNNSNHNFYTLIIDDSREYNNAITSKLKAFDFLTLQAFDLDSANEYIENFKEKLNLIILSIDIENIKINAVIKHIEHTTKAKIIILSNNEDAKQREQFFKHGILDYHLKSNSIEHIVYDINELVERVNNNKTETILVIDDSKLIRFIIKFLLEIRNYNVVTVSNALDGIEYLKENDISLLILDMELPDMHGIKILDLLRDLFIINNFPILVLSGSSNPSIVRQALKKGTSDFLRKPFMYEEFLLKIDLWIKSSRWQKTIKSQKQQIEESLKSFKSLVNATMEALFIFEKNCCVDLNDAAIELTGFNKKSEVLGKGIFEIFKDVSQEHQINLLDDNLDHYFEDTLINSNQDRLQVQFKEKNVSIGNKILKIIAVMDITQIKQKEKILSHQSKMASMGEMIGNIAHQWRQPLTAISVAAGGIKLNYELDMIEEEEILRELDNIVNNTQFLSATIEDFQNFLKDDRSTTNFSLKNTVEKTISIISANLESNDINIVKNFHKNIQINGIQNDLIQVLLNIINNAGDILKTLKNTNQKKYIIIDVNSDDSYINIQIQDSAGGVPANIIGKVFEPYFTTKHQSQGTGLGLYMTHQIIEKMHGTIEVSNHEFIYEDAKFFGARFDIKLPVINKANFQ